MCGARLALCSAPNAHPFKKLYGRTLRVAVFFCLPRPPFTRPHFALPSILERKNNKNSLQRMHIKHKQLSNQHAETSSSTRSAALRSSSARRPARATYCTETASLRAHCLTCTLVACPWPLCTADVLPALSGNARVCFQPLSPIYRYPCCCTPPY